MDLVEYGRYVKVWAVSYEARPKMSEIATLDRLELFLAQVSTTARTASTGSRSESADARSATSNSGQVSQLELYFSEVRYPMFVQKRTPKLRAGVNGARSSNSGEGALKFRLRLH